MDYTRLTAGMDGVSFRNAVDEVVRDFDLAEKRREFNGLKMVPFGDSIWNQQTIQPELIRLLGVTYNHSECLNGFDGNDPTFVPGTGVGSSNSGQTDAMYYRADDLVNYNPGIIICEGGVNDTIGGTFGPASYTHTDSPYEGTNIAVDAPSYVSVLKGMFKKIVEANPGVPFIFMGRFIYETSEPSADTMARIMARRDADEYCCRWAGVRFVDQLTVGVGHLNASTHFSSSAHPNATGGVLLAKAFARAATLI